MERPSVERAILAGFVATLAIMLLMYVASATGLPKLDFAAMLGSLLAGQTPDPLTGMWWMGMFWQFVNGSVIFPLIYAYGLYALLRGAPWLRGLEWGLILWLIAEALVMPMIGWGFFSARNPQATLAVFESLVGHAIWGILLGVMTGGAVIRIGDPRARQPVVGVKQNTF